MSDDGFREIQLSGKQLVFLFMATTVVSVAIFLCGVLVGRGVRARQASELRPIAEGIGGDSQAMGDELLDWTEPIGEAKSALENEVFAEPSKSAMENDGRPTTVGPREPVLPVLPSEVPMRPVGLDPEPPEPFTVQVAALRGRASAEVIRDQLSDKGYPAYLLDPPLDVPGEMFRVRVGRYQDRADAEDVRRRLEQEEKFKPWITR
ncbi:MAG TPA: SPOR domain-containing protein [Acidobacteria bacterium]|nr:SPOR domain-containing protein [Acidobacteriota bacterium]